ncbi:hypothetical protein [Hydrogenophaga flava]|uniref:hypothetical protein n=1 Tax=Hydrogenophaga flava TaxID=65657 RepID=UPI0012F920F3|nr:hypothetical protein [Hydrogenophaga flava]
MKSIRLPAGCEFVPFDGYGGVGFLLAVAEFPDENSLTERMQHDCALGTGLLEAVRQGRLCVRDPQTRTPIRPDAPSVKVLSAVVSLSDLRSFAAELGYNVQVTSAQQETDNQASNVAPVAMPRQRAQESAIRAALSARELDPTRLPKSPKGHAGVKADLRKALLGERHDLFQSEKVFELAWERLRKGREIKYVHEEE